MKDGIIAKLANQAADYYGDAYKQCQYKDTLPKVSNSHGDDLGSAVIVNDLLGSQWNTLKVYPEKKLTLLHSREINL